MLRHLALSSFDFKIGESFKYIIIDGVTFTDFRTKW